MKKISRQSVKSLKRLKVSDHPSFKEKTCDGGCGRKFKTLYYIWTNGKTKDKFCTFCYAATSVVRESEFDSLHSLILPKDSFLPDNPTYLPGVSIDEDIASRARLKGFMPICKECRNDCKIPLTPNVTQFLCADHTPIVFEAKQ